MNNEHPITPPPELVQEWWEEADQYQDDPKTYFDHVATQAAQWGADQELEACCELVPGLTNYLRNARRPNPPSLKAQALDAAQRFYAKGHGDCTDEEIKDDFDTIRRALEQLDD